MPNDRFEQQAKRELATPWVLNQPRLAMLLRREHTALVRLVKQAMGHRMGAYVMLEDPGKMWISRTDLLAALARFKKGTR